MTEPGSYLPPPRETLPPGTPRVRANGMAVASMVLGILGITVGLCLIYFPVMPILAVVLGYLSLGQVRSTGAPGRGFAIAGMVTGYVGIGLAVLFLVGLALGTFTAPTPAF